jgi:hypothetical protein
MNRALALLIAGLLLAPPVALAHPGGLDSNGCHNDRKRGGYHCHGSSRSRNTEQGYASPLTTDGGGLGKLGEPCKQTSECKWQLVCFDDQCAASCYPTSGPRCEVGTCVRPNNQFAHLCLTGYTDAGQPTPEKAKELQRKQELRAAFQQQPCPSTNRTSGECMGYVIQYVVPLEQGGAEDSSNMEWLTVEAARQKHRRLSI